MFPASGMNSNPFQNIPQVWYVSRREYFETYYAALVELHRRLSKIAGGKNVLSVLEAAESLDDLAQQVSSMEETLAAHLPPLSEEHNPYNRNELRRIRELASVTSLQLEAAATKISGGKPSQPQLLQVDRNLYPLIQLIEKVLKWLDEAT